MFRDIISIFQRKDQPQYVEARPDFDDKADVRRVHEDLGVQNKKQRLDNQLAAVKEDLQTYSSDPDQLLAYYDSCRSLSVWERQDFHRVFMERVAFEIIEIQNLCQTVYRKNLWPQEFDQWKKGRKYWKNFEDKRGFHSSCKGLGNSLFSARWLLQHTSEVFPELGRDVLRYVEQEFGDQQDTELKPVIDSYREKVRWGEFSQKLQRAATARDLLQAVQGEVGRFVFVNAENPADGGKGDSNAAVLYTSHETFEIILRSLEKMRETRVREQSIPLGDKPWLINNELENVSTLRDYLNRLRFAPGDPSVRYGNQISVAVLEVAAALFKRQGVRS